MATAASDASAAGQFNNNTKLRDENLNVVTDEISDQLQLLRNLAPNYDYKDVQENGYRRMVKIVQLLLEFADEQSNVRDRVKILNVAQWLLKWTLKIVDINNNFDRSRPVKETDELHVLQFICEYAEQSENLAPLRRQFPARTWTKELQVQLIAKSAPEVFLWSHRSTTLMTFLRCLLNERFAMQTVSSALHTVGNVQTWTDMFNRTQRFPLILLDRLYFRYHFRDVAVEDRVLQVRRRFTIEFDDDQATFTENDTPVTVPIRVKILRNTRADRSKPQNVLFHCHGGGYFALSPEAHQSYLIEYSHSMRDVTIVSFEYPLSPKAKMPSQQQTALDLFCHLRELFADIKSVVLTGDSAGGNLASNLLYIIAEINQLFPDNGLSLPQALVLVFPSLNYSLSTMMASQLMGALEILPLPTTLTVSSLIAMCPVEIGMPDRDFFDREAIRNNPQLTKIENGFVRNKFVSPMRNGRVPGVSLSIITSNACPLFDQSIGMANSWGDAKLDIVDGLPHGFVLMNRSTKNCSDALDLIITRIKESFE